MIKLRELGAPAGGVIPSWQYLQQAISIAELTGESILIDDDYLIDNNVSINSNITIYGSSKGLLRNCYLTGTGSYGDEIPLLESINNKENRIPISSQNLIPGKWLKISGLLNIGSSDAAYWQLGDRFDDYETLGEFVKIKSIIDPNLIEINGFTVFPYTNERGQLSPASWLTSVVRPINWCENVSIKGVRFVGLAPGANTIIDTTFGRNWVLEDCQFDSSNFPVTTNRFKYSLDCRLNRTHHIGSENAITSAGNQIRIISCQNVNLSAAKLENGYQSFDVTYAVNDEDFRGTPSIHCGAKDSDAINAKVDGFTSHPGCYHTTFEKLTTRGCTRGIRVRSRGDKVTNCSLIGGSSGIGVYIVGAALVESIVSNNDITGFLRGIAAENIYQGEGYDNLLELSGGGSKIHDNQIELCTANGLHFSGAPTNKLILTEAYNNTLKNCAADVIYIDSYQNGLKLFYNHIYGVNNNRAGILFKKNTKRLYIGKHFIYKSVLAIKGPGDIMIDDLIKFPSGEGESNLNINLEDIFTDGTKFTSIPVQHGY